VSAESRGCTALWRFGLSASDNENCEAVVLTATCTCSSRASTGEGKIRIGPSKTVVVELLQEKAGFGLEPIRLWEYLQNHNIIVSY
jgi:hypothetical protein